VDALAHRFGLREGALLTLLRPEVASVDAVLTVTIGFVALYGWLRRSGPLAVDLFIVLAVFTIATRAGDVIPPLSSPFESMLFFGGFAAALAYRFLLDSRELNVPGDYRAQRVLWATGIAAAVFGFSALGLSSDSISPTSFETSRSFVAIIIVPPAAVLTSAVALGRLRGRPPCAEPPVSGTPS
jgi:hypothetical protein